LALAASTAASHSLLAQMVVSTQAMDDDGDFATAEAHRPAAAALRASGLVKRFGARSALLGVDLELRRADALLLLGQNGAGKSTLLQICAGVLAPDAGEVRLGDWPVSNPRARASLGFVPQALAIYPRLTVSENLVFFARAFGVSAAELGERVDYGLRHSGLAERAGDVAGTLSGGMQRRLNFACAVLHRPRVLLLDEPTVGVDPASRELLHRAIDEQLRGGAALICSTHRVEEAERLGARVVVMAGGRVRAQGLPGELLSRYEASDLQELMVKIAGEEGY
jgi:ABC-2 type transport system ATP-binding protein